MTCTGEGKRVSLRHEFDLPRGRIDYAVELLYQDPDDLDAMAAHAALTLKQPWSSWRGAPHKVGDSHAVSIYGLAPAGDA